jgi:transcriptional regulator with XRE-family HTH domain
VVFVSDSANAGDVGRPQRTSTPRALIHKKILEVAASMPEATMAEVAKEVSGASTDLVERVLAEYGDPAESETDSGETPAESGDETAADPEDQSEPGQTTDQPEGTVVTDEAETGPDTPAEDPPVRADGDTTVDDRATETAEVDDRATETAEGVAKADDSEQADAGGSETDSETTTDDTPVRTPEELGEKELAVLEVVAKRPDATQAEIADVLGVSRATVSKRASGIEGFDWQRRATFVDRLFGDDADALTRGDAETSTVPPSSLERADARADGDRRRTVESGLASGGADNSEIAARLDRIEDRLDGLEAAEPPANGISDPTLAHKVVHACMESEKVSEEEELRVVSAVLNGDASD